MSESTSSTSTAPETRDGSNQVESATAESTQLPEATAAPQAALGATTESSQLAAEDASGETSAGGMLGTRPTFLFFGIVAAIALAADVASKAWAEITLSQPGITRPTVVLIEDHLAFTLAYNRGGAWGLLHDASEAIRRPFFLGVSLAAVVFIVSLYSRLAPGQRALKWGLPLVLGGALGNLADRVVRSSVVDFIDYRADWIHSMNAGIARVFSSWNVTDHWPTFNVADMCICAGVALMAIDMITSKAEAPPQDGKKEQVPVLPLAADGDDTTV